MDVELLGVVTVGTDDVIDTHGMLSGVGFAKDPVCTFSGVGIVEPLDAVTQIPPTTLVGVVVQPPRKVIGLRAPLTGVLPVMLKTSVKRRPVALLGVNGLADPPVTDASTVLCPAVGTPWGEQTGPLIITSFTQ